MARACGSAVRSALRTSGTPIFSAFNKFNAIQWEHSLLSTNRLPNTGNILCFRPIGCQTLGIFSAFDQ
jgi:hypothetical protein